MRQAVIENPVIDSIFGEPDRFFCFTADGTANEIVSGRRPSSHIIPIASPRKKKTGRLSVDTQWTDVDDRLVR